MESKKIALLGKGGVGKTIISALIGKILSVEGQRILFIDADPARGLTSSLGIDDIKTIGEARIEVIEKAKIADSNEEKERIADIIDYLLLEALYESPDFSLISMGQTDRLGCYCPLNNLVRGTIQEIGSQYDVIIIDAEAGIEQVNRQVVEKVDYPIIVTDNSMRGLNTAFMISDLIEKIPAMEPEKTGVIFNRVDEVNPGAIKKMNEEDLLFYGQIKPDNCISELDSRGDSLFDLNINGESLSSIKRILFENILLTPPGPAEYE